MRSPLKRIHCSLAGLLMAAGLATAAEQPQEVRVDYAYYSPPSLILKHFGWLEEDLKADGVPRNSKAR
jgi:sulfonate transport system substrate-binding protein